MTTEQYITELQNLTLNAINALRITGCADKLADSLSEKLEELAEPPKQTNGKIAIFVEGGIVQGILSNIGETIDVEVVDSDNDIDGAEDRWEELQNELPFGNY
jgi:hypothetical protein